MQNNQETHEFLRLLPDGVQVAIKHTAFGPEMSVKGVYGGVYALPPKPETISAFPYEFREPRVLIRDEKGDLVDTVPLKSITKFHVLADPSGEVEIDLNEVVEGVVRRVLSDRAAKSNAAAANPPSQEQTREQKGEDVEKPV